MRRRAPILIWRMLSADLLRLGLLTALSLTVTIAFALAVRLLAAQKIDLAGAMRLTLLAVVPMLQYALPFAGGFAATLAYHRHASENEALAAMAGGISHRRLLVPAAVFGLALALALAAMAHLIIPAFLRSMEELVTRDVTGVIVRAIERGETVKIDRMTLSASGVVRAGPDPSINATDRLRLNNVLAVTMNDDGDPTGYINADEVNVWLYDAEEGGESATTVQMVFKGASGEGLAGEGAGDAIRSGAFASQRLRIPNTFVDDPKYLTYGQLRALRTRPERLGKIESLRRILAARLSEQRLIDHVRLALRSQGFVLLERPGGERLALTGSDLVIDGRRLRIVPAPGQRGVRMDRLLASGSTIQQEAAQAWLEPDPDPRALPEPGAGIGLRLRGERVTTGDAATPGSARAEVVITGLSAAPARDPAVNGLRVAGLLGLWNQIARRPDLDLRPRIEPAAEELASKVSRLQQEVTSKLHERAAYAAACLLSTLCGGIVALGRQAALPLPVYLVSFFPALATVITISAGQGLTHRAGPAGLLLLWGGVACLGAFTLVEYLRLRRH